jgi:hypothetical protein
MTTTQTRSTERRKAERHGRSLRICWRVLGNRHLRFGEAALKDIGTDGLALKVDQFCPKGTVVIIQFAEAAGRFGEPMLLQAEWSSELPSAQAGTPTYLMGCSFTSPLPEKELKALLASIKNAAAAPSLPKDSPAKTSAGVDPFMVGSASEKRSVLRRGGLTVRVVLSRAGGGTPVEASVVDRSLKGLGILIHRPFTRGTLLNVRPRDAHEKTSSVQVEVRNCRQKGKQWFLGCHFLHTAPANVLMLLG